MTDPTNRDPGTGTGRRARSRRVVARPDTHFDGGLQHERTALAWERTAISTMVAGVLLGRYGAQDAHFTIALGGVLQVALGGGLLVWAGFHYDDLHGPLREGESVVHPGAARLMGLATVMFSSFSLLLAVLLTFAD